ncbi:hypothetical protein ACOSP7_027748 [Xanthoceras sorbifolium]
MTRLSSQADSLEENPSSLSLIQRSNHSPMQMCCVSLLLLLLALPCRFNKPTTFLLPPTPLFPSLKILLFQVLLFLIWVLSTFNDNELKFQIFYFKFDIFCVCVGVGLESDLVGYVFGKKKATEVAHLVWKHVVRKGDIVVDATCGNGYDTLAMLKLVADESGTGRVYGLDVQGEALDNTSSLLDETVNRAEKQLVKLFNICHSKIEELVPKDTSVRLVAFNLGYLPGGDKTVITKSETTLMALEAAERILIQGGLISMVVYVGHPGGREELETVEAFASRLSVDNWICCKFQMLNRPLAPVLVFLFKR